MFTHAPVTYTALPTFFRIGNNNNVLFYANNFQLEQVGHNN